jgi:hypothetical protein
MPAGGILRKLMEEVGPANGKSHFPREAPADDVLDRAMDAGVADGLDALRVQLSGEAALAANAAKPRSPRNSRRASSDCQL